MRRVLLSLLLLLAVLAVAFGAGSRWLARPLPLPGPTWSFDVRPGASLAAVARDLEAAAVVPDARILVALARWRGVDRSIKAGNYEIAQGITLPRLLDKLTQGDVTQTSLTVVEGSTYAQLRAALAAHPGIMRPAEPLTDAELARKLDLPGGSLEGWFFPDTYFFVAGSGELALLRRAHALMRDRLDAAWRARAPDLPLKDPYEALILASIVEKETGRDADRALIAAVFVNRLRLGMRLQADPAVIYGMGARFDGNLRKRDLEADSPYNTYTRGGLPPTPIALPGLRSLAAATQPPRTSDLYFVARGDGSSEFSASLGDHNRAVAKFQKGGR